MRNTIQALIKQGSAGGILLIAVSILALIVANSSLAPYYDALLNIPVAIQIGQFEIAKPLLLWINDGLMAVFFFVIGLELKRELLEGHLSKPGQIILPAAAAIGGIIVPATIFSLINWGNAEAMQGWAIPTATDIAFALGILMLLGDRIPIELKVFLVSLAIFDDIGAIIIIALFYTAELDPSALVVICLFTLTWMNRRHVSQFGPYLFIGVIMWAAVLKSGVHATLAGVALAAFIPLNHANKNEPSPLKTLEKSLHGTVSFQILPIFAFANAGVSFTGMSVNSLFEPVTLGIVLGLFIGKQIGIFGAAWLAVKFKLAELPSSMSWRSIYGVSILAGIGFTMSLFIGSLAYEEGMVHYVTQYRVGILAGTLLSAVTGYYVLKKI